jgi:anthranilate synthase/aminodeoxychorismate synthase-like glutamine amidotransferase
MFLIIDHNDSFTNNLVSWFKKYSKYDVKKLNCFEIDDIGQQDLLKQVVAVVFSPGPGHPLDYPKSISFYQNIPSSIPFLGVCLGHQIMLAAYGANIRRTPNFPIHGRQIKIKATSPSRVLPNYVFNGTFVLYNSLGSLESDHVFQNHAVSLHSENQMCLIAEHKKLPHIGVQFHPESFASSGGHDFLIAFLSQFHL